MTFEIDKDFPMISALVRLSHKYDIAVIKDYAIEGIKGVYTDSYDSWLSIDRSVCRDSEWTRPGERKETNLWKTDAQRSRIFSQAIVVINIARLLNIPSILPAAFYHCACLGGAVVKGYTHENGLTEYLSEDDIVRCINGMQALTAAVADYVPVLRQHLPDHHSCRKSGACRRLWKDAVDDRLLGDWQAQFGTLALRRVVEMIPSLDALCEICKQKAEHLIEERRRRVWRDLPKMFGIASIVGAWPVGSSV